MNTSKRMLSMLLVVALMMSVFVIPASAAAKQTTTELFIDSDGETIAEAVTSTTDAKDAPAIDGYTYSSQSTETTHVYAEQHITYIVGYPDSGVKAENDMTRAEAVVILYRLYNGNYPAYTKRISNDTFADVDSSAWYYKELECLYNAGIIADGENFRPDEPITRAEFATLCARYDGLDYLDKAKFSDVEVGHWAYSYINAAAEKGWIVGYPDGTFKPDNNITRAEVMALVNRLFNRTPTVEQIAHVKNPYNDIVSTHWAYCDVIEATVKHDMVDWHGAEYNDGVYNIIIEKYVDTKGNEIANAVTTESKTNYHPAEITDYSYLGYITILTYVYKTGTPAPGITKTAGVSAASVGDTVKYTVTLSNGKDATAAWNDVIMVDEIPEHMSLVHGSVYLNGKHTDYSLVDGLLSVDVGSIEAGKSVNIVFEVKVLTTGYGVTIINEATGTGSSGGPVSDTDNGITIDQGEIMPYLSKTPDVSYAVVGQTITYTLNVGNASSATYPWENAVITDVIPEGLSLVDGSMYLDGNSCDYSYKDGVLSVELGNIAPGVSHALTFKTVVQESAYGTTIYNTAVGAGGNTPDVDAPDTGVSIKDGEAVPGASKTASVTTAVVGDTIIYTIEAKNGKDATAAWVDATITDVLPEYVSFVYGSIQISGIASASYSYKPASRELTISLGDILPGEAVSVTFAVTVNDNAYGETIYNTAILSGSNTPDIEAPDDGVMISDGTVEPYASKNADKSEASVGDTILYTVTVGNSRFATEAWENVVMTDALSSYLTFTHGSVQVDGKSAEYSYSGGVLTVALGDIDPHTEKVVTFEAVVNSTAYNTTIRNTAIMTGDNTTKPVEVSDEGVSVGKGVSEGTATKTANVATAQTGDTITYTVQVKNSSLATYPWENAVITDAIPEYLTFIEGSVQIGGKATTDYSYSGGKLTIYLGNIAPGATVTATFRCTVNADAQGQFIVNTAYVSGDSHDTVPAPDKGVEIASESPIPSVSKRASVSKATVGDTITYTVTAANNVKATVDWENVIITDTIPLGLDFVDGSVYVGGKLATYTFVGRILTINVGDVAPGETVEVTFKATVSEDARGSTIENVAIASGDNSGQLLAPDNGVKIDEGTPAPSVSKTASVSEASVGEAVTYTITATNSIKATADWRNVTVTDVIPDGFDFKHGSVHVNGASATYSYSGRALTVHVGDLTPGETAVITFSVTVTDDAQGKTVYNTATVSGDNYTPGTSTDNGVKVPEESYGGDPNSVYGSKIADKISVKTGDFITYTIVAGNNSNNSFTWYDVHLYDIIDTSLTKMVIDTVTIDGRKTNAAEVEYYGGQLIVKLGAIEPGQEVTVTFKVKVTSEAAGELIGNTATLKGSNVSGGTYNTSVRISLATSIPSENDKENEFSDIHYGLFEGYENGEWRPDRNLTRAELATLYYRLLAKPTTSGAKSISDVDSSFWAYTEIQFAVSKNLLYLDDGAFNPDESCTRADLGRLFTFVLGENFGFTSLDYITRINVAKAIVEYSSRHHEPITNGASLISFPDIPASYPYYWVVMEVSNDHDWYLDSSGQEYWDN